MKNICKLRRYILGFGIFAVSATLTLQASANPFEGGGTNTISSNIDYNDLLVVGSYTSDNTLNITNEAVVGATQLIVGENDGASNNTLNVTDNSFLLIGNATTNGLSGGGLVVGSSDNATEVSISLASTLNTENLYVGYGATNDNGRMTLTQGSEINVLGNAVIGSAGSGNALVVANGTTMTVGGDVMVGGSGGANNEFSVSGNLLVNSTDNIIVSGSNNKVDIEDHGKLQITGDLDTTALDGLGVTFSDSGKLEVGGQLSLKNNEIDSSLNIILNNTLSTNTANLQITSGTYFNIGDTTSDNSLTLTNGATATIANRLNIGNTASADDNTLSIGGTGSSLVALQDTLVGVSGEDNTFEISDGAQANLIGDLYIGKNSTGNGNTVTVGSNATLSAFGSVTVGDNGDENTLSINYGTVTVANDLVLGSAGTENRYYQTGGTNTVSGSFIIGKTAGASGTTGNVNDDLVETTGNLAIVGEDATLNLQDLTVGLDGSGSIMVIRDGGLVDVDGDVVIGESVGDNYIYLQRDSNTQFNVTGDLIVGKEGGSNRFAAYGGTANIGGDLYLGATTNQHVTRNFIHLETTNAVLNVADTIYIGASNSVNEFDLREGAVAYAQDLVVGGISGVSNNAVTVYGENTLLYLTNSVTVGAGGNSVQVDDDAWLVVGESTTNLPTSDGGAIAVGNSTGTATLSIGEGSSAEAGYVYIGIGTNDIGSVTVTGSNATLTATQDLVIGVDGSSNTLTIADGATASGNVFIGQNAGANSNRVVVSGADSILEAGDVTIGMENNSGNSLDLDNGGQFTLSGVLTIASNNMLNINAGSTFSALGDFDLTAQSTNGFNLNDGSILEVGGALTATNALDGGRSIVLDGGSWNVGTNLLVGINTDSNNVSVTGDGALLSATGIEIGSTTTVGNSLLIGDGGKAEIDDFLQIAAGNLLNLGSNGWLTVKGDLDTASLSAGAFLIGSNATLEVGGLLTASTNLNTIQSGQTLVLNGGLSTNHTASWNVGTDLFIGGILGAGNLNVQSNATLESASAFIGNSDSNRVSITGAGSLWTVAGDLTVGTDGSYNELLISAGATNTVSNDAFIGLGTSSNNTVTITGADSLWSIGNNLMIGDLAENGNNWLQVLEGAHASIGSDLSLTKGSTLEIGENSTVKVDGAYTQDESSTLDVVAWQTANGSLEVGGDATFSNDTKVVVRGDGTIAENPYEFIVVGAGNLQFGTSNSLDSISIDLVGFADGATNFVFDNKLIVSGEADSLSSIIGVGEGSQLGEVSAEIDELAMGSDPVAINMRRTLIDLGQPGNKKAMDNYYGEKASSTPANNMINIGLQSIAQQITMRADNTRSRMGVASSQVNWNKPAGVAGPHESGQELQGWVSGFATTASQDGSGGFNDYDAHVSGFMVGADFSVVDNILVGLAGGAGRTSLDSDSSDAEADTKTTFVAAYASTGTKDWFADTSIIFGNSSIDSDLGNTFDTEADYDAKNIAFYLGGGKEITGKYLIFTPQASILANYYDQDSYTEDSTTAVARDIDSFDEFYLQSSLGASLGFYTTMGDVTLKPEIRLHWLHEWNADDASLDYSLVGGANNYSLKLQAPEEDILKLGIGTSAKLGDYLELRADLDTRQGSDYSDYSILGSIRYQF